MHNRLLHNLFLPPTPGVAPCSSKMHLLIYLLLSVSFALAQGHGEEESKEMGPVAFMWPPDRDWGAAFDNTAPCGSVDETLDRTEFPMRKS